MYYGERLYSTGYDDVDALMEKAFSEGYWYAQREFAEDEEDEIRRRGRKGALIGAGAGLGLAGAGVFGTPFIKSKKYEGKGYKDVLSGRWHGGFTEDQLKALEGYEYGKLEGATDKTWNKKVNDKLEKLGKEELEKAGLLNKEGKAMGRLGKFFKQHGGKVAMLGGSAAAIGGGLLAGRAIGRNKARREYED